MKNAFNQIALIVVDAQKKYSDPCAGQYGTDETDAVAKRIQTLVDDFHKAGLPVYFVYDSEGKEAPAAYDFHRVQPSSHDTLIGKNTFSAWKTVYSDIRNHIDQILTRDHIAEGLVVGFNTSACLRETALDMKAYGYQTTVIEDLTANGSGYAENRKEESLAQLRWRNVKVETLEKTRERIPALNGPLKF